MKRITLVFDGVSNVNAVLLKESLDQLLGAYVNLVEAGFIKARYPGLKPEDIYITDEKI